MNASSSQESPQPLDDFYVFFRDPVAQPVLVQFFPAMVARRAPFSAPSVTAFQAARPPLR